MRSVPFTQLWYVHRAGANLHPTCKFFLLRLHGTCSGRPGMSCPRLSAWRDTSLEKPIAACTQSVAGAAIVGGIRQLTARLRQFISRARLSAHDHYAVSVTGHTAQP